MFKWIDMEMEIDPNCPYARLKNKKYHDGRRGRPKYVIQSAQLVFLRELHFS